MTNIFDVNEKEMAGKVIVRTRPSPLVEGRTIRHVVRNTADDAVVATRMTRQTDVVKARDMEVVMNAFVASVKELVSEGNAVRISGIGTFYLTAKDDGAGDNEFGVGFTPAQGLVEAARCAEAKAVMESESAPVLETVLDMETMEENNTVTAGLPAVVSGERLRVAGDEEETGVYLAPCDAEDNCHQDRRDWVRVASRFVWRNFMGEVMFKVPNVKGRHRVVIATKAPLNGSHDEALLLKHARVGMSEVVNVV